MATRRTVARPLRPFRYRRQQLFCEGASCEALAAEFGTPLYVYSAGEMLHRLRLFQRAFRFCPATVCYAVKANSSLAILRLLGQAGAGFDIVSGGELERVRRAYRPALRRAVFSGVGKQRWEIDAALADRILLFNVESEPELDLLAERATELRVRTRFALRVNPDVFAETHPYISTGLREHKFGIEMARARDLYRRYSKHGYLEPAGVSVHIGSQIESVAPFAAALERVAELVRELRADGLPIRYVDAGGGLGIDYHAPVGGGSGSTGDAAPSADPAAQVQQYAAALEPVLRELDIDLLLEPGRFLVAPAGALLTRVVNVKRTGSKHFVVTDAGMNDLIRPALYQAHHEIVPVRKAAGARQFTADVVGPVCESGDFFAQDRTLAPVRTGDLLAVLDAGAYGMSQASNYNSRPRAAEVLVEGDAASLIRRRETMRDLLALERMP